MSARAGPGPGADGPAPRAADRLSFLIHRVNARISATANRVFRIYDIESFGARILVLLLERDEQRVGALVEAMSLPQPTLSHHLKRLERRGLIRRRRIAEDNRSVAVGLTPAGRTVALDCEAVSARVYRHMVRDLSEAEVAEMRRALVLMAETLEAYEDVPLAPAGPAARSRPVAEAGRGRSRAPAPEQASRPRARRADA